jgi:hypothetical protein
MQEGHSMVSKTGYLIFFLSAITAITIHAASSHGEISDANWVSMGGMPGITGRIFAMMSDGNGNLYAAGAFNLAGGFVAKNIAKWNGSSWNALGSGANNSITDITFDGSGNLYGAGDFDTIGNTPANHVAKWDGSKWISLGSAIAWTRDTSYKRRLVTSIITDPSGDVYVAGNFDTAGGVYVRNIAKWDGKTWSGLGSGVSGCVQSLTRDGSGNIYAGGEFDSAGGIAVNHIAKWNGSAWIGLGGGADSTILAVAADSLGNIYAGGCFRNAGGTPSLHIAKWNGNVWSALGSGIDSVWISNEGFRISIDKSGSLYLGGALKKNDFSTDRLLKWDGARWSTLGGGNYPVYSLHVDASGAVYAGGWDKISKWDGSALSEFGRYGTNGSIHDLSVDSSNNIYAGGFFTAIGGSNGTPARGIAKWNGSAWTSIDGYVEDKTVFYSVGGMALSKSNDLYASGFFGPTAKTLITKWNGEVLNEIGVINPDGISDLTFSLDRMGNLYVGGHFDSISGIAAHNIAKWDGHAWKALGSGIRGGSSSYNVLVRSLALDSSGNLYAAGRFDTVGDVSASNIAKWNGSSWSALGSGMKNSRNNTGVWALLTDNTGNLYAGGYFDTAGGKAVNNIAKWDGNVWSALGSGIEQVTDPSPGVFALASDSKGNIYAGGGFTTAGGITASFIAQWDGSRWRSLTNGFFGGNDAGRGGNCVYAMVIDSNDNLYAGGEFLRVGEKVSPYIAKCSLTGAAIRRQAVPQNSPRRLTYDSGSNTLHFPPHSGLGVSYRIFTLAGREASRDALVLSKGKNSLRIENATLARGAYIAQVFAGKESARFRMMVENR